MPTLRKENMHKRLLDYFFIVLTAGALIVMPAGCSQNNKQQAEEKGSIEKMTDKAAETAAEKIRTPMDKARATQNLGDDRLEAMDKALQKQ